MKVKSIVPVVLSVVAALGLVLAALTDGFNNLRVGTSETTWVETQQVTVLEKQITVTHNAFDGTKRFCRLIVEFRDGHREYLEGKTASGQAPYEAIGTLIEGDTVTVKRRVSKYYAGQWHISTQGTP